MLDSTNTQYKIRLLGIDAPEKKQPFGQVSKQSLSDMVYNKHVRVDWEKKDRYKRVIGKVYAGQLDTNLEQIKRGLAWHYTKYQLEQSADDRRRYQAAQQEAMLRNKGLWMVPNQVAPWDWRKSGGKLSTIPHTPAATTKHLP